MSRFGRCRAINLSNKRQCKNPANGNGFCFHPIHQAMYGIGHYTEQLAPIQDFGPMDDPTCPRGNIKLTVAHIKAKIALAKHNTKENSK